MKSISHIKRQQESETASVATSKDVTPLKIPEREISFTFSCSGGKGGQNVNKRATKVRLAFDVLNSDALTLEQKTAVLRHPSLSHLVKGDGVINICCQVHRTQLENREAALKLLNKIIQEALSPKKERIPGGRPPHLKYEPSEHRKRQARRQELAKALAEEMRDRD